MDWLWPVLKDYIEKELLHAGYDEPTDDQLEAVFFDTLARCSVTVLVQEPWQNSVRFKTLAKLTAAEATELYADPVAWLSERYGGGKFKLNFHKGWHFVATQNFKPDGPQLWTELPDLSDELGPQDRATDEDT